MAFEKTMKTTNLAGLLLVLFLSGVMSTATAQRRKTNVDLIIRGGTVVTMDGSRRVIEDGAVAVKAGRVVDVDDTADIDRRYAAREVINAGGKVVAVFPVDQDSEIMIITQQAKLIRLEAGEIRKTGRSAQGVRLIKTDEGDKVTSASLVEAAAEDETEEVSS